MCGLLTYLYAQEICINTSRMVYSTDSLSLPVLTHRPVSISVHNPNQYSGENPPQTHSTIPSVDVYTNANTILCCQPFINNRTCTRYSREKMRITVIEFPFTIGYTAYNSWLPHFCNHMLLLFSVHPCIHLIAAGLAKKKTLPLFSSHGYIFQVVCGQLHHK